MRDGLIPSCFFTCYEMLAWLFFHVCDVKMCVKVSLSGLKIHTVDTAFVVHVVKSDLIPDI